MCEPARRQTFAVALLFVVLTLVATYPIARAPASYAFFNHADAQLNMWILAWDAHALQHDPLNLFNSNIFFPEKRTLAYSETLIGYAPIFVPILWLRGSPALAFNAVLLFSFAASGFAMFLLTRRLTGRDWPAIVAGIAYAFTPYRFAHIPQIQLESMEWMPLAFLFLHRFLERHRWREAAGLGACVAMQMLCCTYYAFFLIVALGVALPLLLLGERWREALAAVAKLGIVACLTALIVAPVAGEYVHVHRAQGLERSMEEITSKSATAATYLSSPARLHQRLWASSQRPPRDYLFPGMLALLFAALALRRIADRSAPSRGARPIPSTVITYATVAAAGLVLSMGPTGVRGVSLYDVFYSAVPWIHGLRQVSRFGVLAVFAVSVLAAFGAAAVEEALRRRGAVLPAIVAAIVFVELIVAPLRTDRPGGEALVSVPMVPAVYDWLARQPGSFSILELPYTPPGQMWENGAYVYWSTAHWHGVVDGYSGFSPPTYPALARILAHFPDDLSHDALTVRHVRYVIVHRNLYKPWNPPLNFDLIRRTPWLLQAQSFSDVDVYTVLPDARLLTYARGH